MAGLTLRAALPTEIAALEALQWRSSTASGTYRQSLRANPAAVRLPAEQLEAGQVRVAERGGQVVGFSVVLPRPDGETELDGLFVEPVHFRSGVGSALVEEAARKARALGAAWLHVVANPEALAFYRALGFEDIGSCTTQFGPARLMRRSSIR